MYEKHAYRKWLIIILIAMSFAIEYVNANCTNWNFFLEIEEVQCNSNQTDCCGWLKTDCCTKVQKNKSEEIRKIICRVIVTMIVIGIILIFIAFLIGWIYSCYLIAKQIQETSEESEDRSSETNQGRSLFYSFFTRYINTISTNQQSPNQQSEVFIVPINDKPPSYNSLFKTSNENNMIHQQDRLMISNERFLFQNNNQSINHSIRRPSQQSNTAYINDELPPYTSAVFKNSHP